MVTFVLPVASVPLIRLILLSDSRAIVSALLADFPNSIHHSSMIFASLAKRTNLGIEVLDPIIEIRIPFQVELVDDFLHFEE
jgi:hypothetical protein